MRKSAQLTHGNLYGGGRSLLSAWLGFEVAFGRVNIRGNQILDDERSYRKK